VHNNVSCPRSHDKIAGRIYRIGKDCNVVSIRPKVRISDKQHKPSLGACDQLACLIHVGKPNWRGRIRRRINRAAGKGEENGKGGAKPRKVTHDKPPSLKLDLLYAYSNHAVKSKFSGAVRNYRSFKRAENTKVQNEQVAAAIDRLQGPAQWPPYAGFRYPA